MSRDYGATNVQQAATAPTVGPAGSQYWDTTLAKFYVSDGTSWIEFGATGPAGPPGGSYLSAQWNFNQNTSVSPSNGTMRMDATTYGSVTTLWIAELDRDGLDRSVGLGVAVAGDQIIMQSAQGRAVWNVVSQADSGTYRTFSVTLAESSGTRPSASSTTTIYILNNKTGHPIQDEGTTLNYRTKLNFVGAGVTATDDLANDRTNITIPGGSGGGTTIISGLAAPTAGDGAGGDYYLDTDNNILYGPKNAGYGSAYSLYTSQVPSSFQAASAMTLGLDIVIATAGRITGLKYYRAPSDSNVATFNMRLWTTAGVALGSATFTGEAATPDGWRTANLSSPVSVTAGQTVVVAIDCTNRMSSVDTGTFTATNSGLTSLAQNRWVATSDVFPSGLGSGRNYIDIVYEPALGEIWPIAISGKIVASSTAPSSPVLNDLWVDTT